MEKFDELLEKLKALNIIQKKGEWSENIPDDIWNDYFEKNFKEIRGGLDVDTRRWYETSVMVVSIFGRFLGVRYITNLFSESSDYKDCYVKMEFFEMKEIQITSYAKL